MDTTQEVMKSFVAYILVHALDYKVVLMKGKFRVIVQINWSGTQSLKVVYFEALNQNTIRYQQLGH